MSRKIVLELLESGVSTVAELLEDRAPLTCEAIWRALEHPLETKALHGIWTGRTLEIDIPDKNRNFDPDLIPLENATTTPVRGDMLWEYIPTGQIRSLFDGVWNIVVSYGPEALIRTPLGPQPANVWAEIRDEGEEFYRACAKTWFGKAQTIQIKRLE
jgi:hypothetical protein